MQIQSYVDVQGKPVEYREEIGHKKILDTGLLRNWINYELPKKKALLDVNITEDEIKKILLSFIEIEKLPQKHFCSESVRDVLEKILEIALQLPDKCNIDIVLFFPRTQLYNDFKFDLDFRAGRLINENMEEYLQYGYRYLQGLEKLTTSTLSAPSVQNSIKELIGVIFRLSEKSGIDIIQCFTRTQAEKILEFALKVAEKSDIDVVQFITKARANHIVLEPDNRNLALPTFEKLVLPEPMNKGEKGRYEKWADRKNKDEQPLDFLERVWGKYIRAGLLYQTDLRGEQHGETPKRGLDKTLFDRVFEQCKSEKRDLKQFIPTQSDKIINKVLTLVPAPQLDLKETLKEDLYKKIYFK